MEDEYKVILASPPGETGETAYLKAVDDEHATRLASNRWPSGDVTAVSNSPRGHQAGTAGKVWA